MDVITTQSKGNQFVEVEKEFILEDTTRTRIVFKASMHPGGIRGDIIRYRKDPNGVCEEIVPVNFNSLHPDEGIKITLSTDATRAFHETIKELALLLEERGIHYGVRDFTLVDRNALVVDDANKAEIIRKLLDANYGEDVWAQLVENNPDIATRLANSKIHEDRVATLRRFEAMICNSALRESDWQDFFEENTWIFGYGLRYQVLRVIQAQPNYGGADITGSGGQRGDFLTATEAETKYTCLVEIKKPSTHLLLHEQYRNGAWSISKELSGAISQIQANCAQWEISDSRAERNRERLGNTYTISPKGIVVIGNTGELRDWDMRSSFERFRRELRCPEIVTYDELLERARFIVGETTSSAPEDDWELPF